jgi:hypothetical protein
MKPGFELRSANARSRRSPGEPIGLTRLPSVWLACLTGASYRHLGAGAVGSTTRVLFRYCLKLPLR